MKKHRYQFMRQPVREDPSLSMYTKPVNSSGFYQYYQCLLRVFSLYWWLLPVLPVTFTSIISVFYQYYQWVLPVLPVALTSIARGLYQHYQWLLPVLPVAFTGITRTINDLY